MSTEIYNAKLKDTKITVLRFCAPENEGKDRVRIRIILKNGLEYKSSVVMTRKQWENFKESINDAFAMFPVCESCGEKTDSYAKDFNQSWGLICSDCWKNRFPEDTKRTYKR